MTPAEYRDEANRLAAAGERAKAAGLRAAATRAERALGYVADVDDARRPAPIRRPRLEIPARLQAIADGLTIPVDETGALAFACVVDDAAGWRLAWALDGGRAKRIADDVEPLAKPHDAARLALAVNARINR